MTSLSLQIGNKRPLITCICRRYLKFTTQPADWCALQLCAPDRVSVKREVLLLTAHFSAEPGTGRSRQPTLLSTPATPLSPPVLPSTRPFLARAGAAITEALRIYPALVITTPSRHFTLLLVRADHTSQDAPVEVITAEHPSPLVANIGPPCPRSRREESRFRLRPGTPRRLISGS